MTSLGVALADPTGVVAESARSDGDVLWAPYAAAKPVRQKVVAAMVAALDTTWIILAGVVPLAVASAGGFDFRPAALVMVAGCLVALNLLHLSRAYRFETLKRLSSSVGPLLLAWCVGSAVVGGLVWGLDLGSPRMRVWLGEWGVGTLALLLADRAVLHLLVKRWQVTGRLSRVVAVIGAGRIGQRLLRHLNAHPDPQLKIAGVYDDRKARLPSLCMGHGIVGTVDDLIKDVRRFRVDEVLVAMPLSADARLARVMNKLRMLPVEVHLCADQFGFQLGSCEISRLSGLTFLTGIERPMNDWSWLAKAIEDRVLAALILLLISPVMLLAALAIKLESPGPVFFKQKRYGYNNQLIHVYKFRSMYHNQRDENASRLTTRNDPRVTRVGAFLRRTSIDELPQFINVLKGEMSIVGPRPHALAAKAGGLLYQDAVLEYDARHRVKPGITGWAQVNGWRGETETITQIKKRVEHDLYYIEHGSVLFDLKIILKTILVGFTGQNAY